MTCEICGFSTAGVIDVGGIVTFLLLNRKDDLATNGDSKTELHYGFSRLTILEIFTYEGLVNPTLPFSLIPRGQFMERAGGIEPPTFSLGS